MQYLSLLATWSWCCRVAAAAHGEHRGAQLLAGQAVCHREAPAEGPSPSTIKEKCYGEKQHEDCVILLMNATLARSRACFKTTQAKGQGHAEYDKCVLGSCGKLCSSNKHCEGVCGDTGKSVWGCWTKPQETMQNTMSNGTMAAMKAEAKAEKKGPSLLAAAQAVCRREAPAEGPSPGTIKEKCYGEKQHEDCVMLLMNATLARSKACFKSTRAKTQGGTKDEWHTEYDKCVLGSCGELCSSNQDCEGVCGDTGKSVWGCWTKPQETMQNAMSNGTMAAMKAEAKAAKKGQSLLAGRPRRSASGDTLSVGA